MEENELNEVALRRLNLNLEVSDRSPDNKQDLSPLSINQENDKNNLIINGCDENLTSNNTMESESSESISPPFSADIKPKDAMVIEMLERLSHSSAHFKHQQRNEPDLTPEEKFQIAHSLFEKSPTLFLSRFNKYLTCKDVACFEEYIGDYEIDFHLKEILAKSSPSYKRNKVKNRRYKALMQMMSVGDEYFTEEAMKARDPLLYEEMIGQYLTKEERSSKAAEIMNDSEFVLSNFLIRHMDQIHENNLYYNLKEKMEECFEEMDSDTEEEIESDDCPKITKAQKKNFRVEFLQIMQERFLDGKDTDYDYSSIDNNDTYDDLDEESKDEEEKYFDDEEPEFVDDANIS